MANYRINEDVRLIRELLDLSQKQFAEKIGVDAVTVARWETEEITASDKNMEKIYTCAFDNKIFLNEIKAQLYEEDLANENRKVLYHGAKSIIDGAIDSKH